MKFYPKESEEQRTLMEWAERMRGSFPELDLLFHIPNGGSRNAIEARHLKEQGVKPGVPDLFLPVSRGGFFGLFIEMKRQDGGKLSETQTHWIMQLNMQGYLAGVCAGWEEAARLIISYLKRQKVAEGNRETVKK